MDALVLIADNLLNFQIVKTFAVNYRFVKGLKNKDKEDGDKCSS